jgi:hypothetical protein
MLGGNARAAAETGLDFRSIFSGGQSISLTGTTGGG